MEAGIVGLHAARCHHRFNARGGSDRGEGEGGAAFSRRLSSVNFVVCH